MATTPNGADSLGRVRDALFDTIREAHRLADATEQLEVAYATEKGPIDPGYFYVPSTMQTGRELNEPTGEDDRIPVRERKPRGNAITAVLMLRAAVDTAIEAVSEVADYMDSPQESVDRRWTTHTIGRLRILRGAILRGHSLDILPSALPMIRAGVPQSLRDAAKAVAERMEEVKSAILAGVQRRPVPPTMAPELVTRLEAAAAALSSLGARNDGESTPPVSSPGSGEPDTKPLTADHESVLAVLARSPLRCKTVIDVAGDGTIRNRETVGRLLRELADVGLVERPRGKRKGYALTTRGKARIELLKAAT